MAGPELVLTNKKGSKLTAELIRISKTEATVKRASDQKVFVLPLASLDEASVQMVEKHRGKLEEFYPEYESTVVVGKRNVDRDQSFAKKTQTVTSTVRIKNLDPNVDSPKVKGRIVFFGHNQSRNTKYSVLATRDFEVEPESEKTTELVLAPFETEYYRGYSDWGFRYEGYILMLYGQKNKIVHHMSKNATINRAIEDNFGLLEIFRQTQEKTEFGKDFTPLDEQGRRKGGDVITVKE